MRGWLRSLELPPWIDSPPPPGWSEALWAAFWTVRYLLATMILLGALVLVVRVPV